MVPKGRVLLYCSFSCSCPGNSSPALSEKKDLVQVVPKAHQLNQVFDSCLSYLDYFL